MNADELKEKLKLHDMWLKGFRDGVRLDLRSADLSSADLRSADLRYADLSSADLRYANLRSADLRYANLRYANLRSADLRYADLSSADLRSADLRSAKEISQYVKDITMACPESGSFVGWKKVNGVIVKLLIPEGAKRSSSTSRKCRAEFAEVLEVDGAVNKVVNKSYNHETIYEVGKRVTPNSFDEDRWNECSNGIHFFITRGEAERY
mgnify:CR=1 FL=1